MAALIKLIALLTEALTLVPSGTALWNTIQANRDQAQKWADTGYVPTNADWDALNATTKADEAAIDAAAQ